MKKVYLVLQVNDDTRSVVKVFSSEIYANIYSDMITIKTGIHHNVEEFFVDKELPENIFQDVL